MKKDEPGDFENIFDKKRTPRKKASWDVVGDQIPQEDKPKVEPKPVEKGK